MVYSLWCRRMLLSQQFQQHLNIFLLLFFILGLLCIGVLMWRWNLPRNKNPWESLSHFQPIPEQNSIRKHAVLEEKSRNNTKCLFQTIFEGVIQCLRSGLRNRWFQTRIRLQHFRLITNPDQVPDPDAGFWWSKIVIKLQLKKLIKNCNLLTPRTP